MVELILTYNKLKTFTFNDPSMPAMSNESAITSEEVTLSIAKLIDLKRSSSATESVLDHQVITVSTWVMYHFPVNIDFTAQRFTFVQEGHQYIVEYSHLYRDESLLRIIECYLKKFYFDIDDVLDIYEYSIYHNSTRAIFDHLDRYNDVSDLHLAQEFISLSLIHFRSI